MDDLTLLRQIADAAFTVRDRQRTYFRTRDRNVLARSKDAERHLDQLIAQRQEQRSQGDMFSDLTNRPQPP